MLTQKIKQLFDKTRENTNDCVGYDQYGTDDKVKLYIISVSDDYNKITVSNGREYTLEESPPTEMSEYTDISWYPKEQYGDWDIIMLANHGDGFRFIHGS